jgi:hypothetical protein
MTDVYKTPEKVARKYRLFDIGLETLRAQNWKVERIAGAGKASVRLITKGGQSRRVSVRTTQDQWIAFPRQADDKGWVTLSEVDVVLAVSVDDVEHPNAALVHWIEGDDMRARFDRGYKARREAGHQIPLGRGVWLPLYIAEDSNVARYVGGGAGIDHPEIARVPLDSGAPPPDVTDEAEHNWDEDRPLTISEAKRRLALSLGVPESSIKISVEA